MFIRTSTILSLIFLCSQSHSEEVAEIPLSEIWAGGMPGTKPLGTLCAGFKSDRECGAYFSGINKAIQFNKRGESAKKGFVVLGIGHEALREVYRVCVDKAETLKTVPHGKEISLVFFTHEIHPYVRLQKVEVSKRTINVRYKFIPHETEDMSQYLALIPLGRLPLGEYQVNFLMSDLDPEFAGGWFERSKDKHALLCVCGNYSFSVGEKVQ